MNREIVSLGQLLLALLGLAAWLAAAGFALGLPTVEVKALDKQGNFITLTAPNMAAAGASCGFAVAGAICFLGAARGSRGGADHR